MDFKNLSPGERLKIYRITNRLTQGELAKIIQYSQMHVSRFERNLASPKTNEEIEKIESKLGVKIWSLKQEAGR